MTELDDNWCAPESRLAALQSCREQNINFEATIEAQAKLLDQALDVLMMHHTDPDYKLLRAAAMIAIKQFKEQK